MRYRLKIGLTFSGAAIVLGLVIVHFATISAQSILPLGGLTAQVSSIAFSPDGKLLASGSCGQPKIRPTRTELGLAQVCPEGEIRLWDAASGQQLGQPFKGHTGYVTRLAFSQDGKILASLGQDKMVILWDALERNPITRIDTHHNGPPTVIGFSPGGKLLARSE